MIKHSFQGFPGYLDRAATAIAHPEASLLARRITPLAAIANLCAQATTAEGAQAAAILEKATEFRHQLHVAAMAADMMLEDVFGAVVAGPSTQRERRHTKANASAE